MSPSLWQSLKRSSMLCAALRAALCAALCAVLCAALCALFSCWIWYSRCPQSLNPLEVFVLIKVERVSSYVSVFLMITIMFLKYFLRSCESFCYCYCYQRCRTIFFAAAGAFLGAPAAWTTAGCQSCAANSTGPALALRVLLRTQKLRGRLGWL